MRQNISLFGLLLSVLVLSGTYLCSSSWGSAGRNAADDTAKFADISKFPMEFANWKGQKSGALGDMELNILKLDSWLKRAYVSPSGSFLSFYLGYWKRQTGDYQAAKHSPLLCLPSNGWTIRKVEVREIAIPGSDKNARVARLVGEIKNHTSVVYFWFFAGEEVYTSDFRAILRSGLGTLFSGRSDGGIIEITVPVKSVKGDLDAGIRVAEDSAEDFIREMYPSFVSITKDVVR